MRTHILSPTRENINLAAKKILSGRIVAFPTETVYGLGANALSSKAVEKIFIVKGRPNDNPLIVHVASLHQLNAIADDVNSRTRKLIKKFWPGPLTLLFKRSSRIPNIVTGGLETVAVRMPQNKIARALIRAAGLPIAAPSANLAGRPSPTTAEHVMNDFDGKISCILDGGMTKIGIESTVLDTSTETPVLLRPGSVTQTQIENCIGKRITVTSATSQKQPRSPGMKYAHYAPQAPLFLVLGGAAKINRVLLKNADKNIGIFAGAKNIKASPKNMLIPFGKSEKIVAQKLYSALRLFDKKNMNLIVVQGITQKGIGRAVMNRLEKAASKIIR